MDGMVMGTPWIDEPLELHSYREFECQFNDTALCEYEQGYWRFWYEADHRYALPTIALFLSTIIIFAMAHLFDNLAPASVKSTNLVRRMTALGRLLSYRAFRIPSLNWNSAPVGILALGALGTIYFLCMTLAPKPYYWPNTDEINFGNSPPLATRSGWLSLACLPFVFATAGKSNFITLVTGVGHEKLQVFHRWISYAFFVTALMHTFPFIVYDIKSGIMESQWDGSVCYWTGVVALIAQGYLTFASMSPLRSMNYEWFKFSHFVAGLVFVLFLFFHCDHTLSAWDYFIATGVLFSLSWLHRQIRVYFEHGVRHQAHVSLVANGFVCVRIPTKATWGVGQHFFVRFLSMGIHMGSIHPFTACSLPAAGTSFDDKASELVLYIRPQGGLTARLALLAETQPDRAIRVLLDGPYGGINHQKLATNQRQLVIAGGSGAGWLLPIITAFLRRHQARNADEEMAERLPPQSAKFVLATRDKGIQIWFEEAVDGLLATFDLEYVPKGLEIEVHYTGGGEVEGAVGSQHHDLDKFSNDEKSAVAHSKPASASSDSDSSYGMAKFRKLQHFRTRPDLAGMVRSEAASSDLRGQLGVYVCGPLSMQSDVSNAVADAQVAVLKGGSKDIYLHMEHFSWA